MKGYHQITEKERYTISHLRKLKFTPSQIARQLGRHRSTIVREYKRNGKQGGQVYRPSKAQEQANGRRSRSRKKSQYSTETDGYRLGIFAPLLESRASQCSPED